MGKRVFRWAAIALGLMAAVIVALPFVVDANTFRPQLESELSAALGRPVKLGALKLSILSGAVAADDLSVADDPAYSRAPFVQAKSVKIGVELVPLILSRKLNVTSVAIEEPQISLIESPSGEWNFSGLGGKPPSKAPASPSRKLDLSVKSMKISHGHFSLGRLAAHDRPLVLEDVNVEVRDFSAASAFPFSLSANVVGGGDIHLDGTLGPLNEGDLSRTAATANLKVSKLDLAASGWTQAAPGMAGIVTLDGTVTSDGRTASVKGRIQAEKLKLAQRATPAPRPVALDFTAQHQVQARAGRVTQGDIHIGAAVASLTGAYAAQGDATVLHMSLSGPNMPVQELAAMLPALGIALPAGSSLQGGTAAVKVAMDGPADRLVTAGTIALNNTTLAGFDLGRKMAVVEALAGMKGGPNTEIQSLGGNLRIGPEGTAAENLQLVVPAIGQLAGSGTISPANALDFRMTAKLHTAGLMASVADSAIPFLVQGTCADPVFRPDVKSVVKDKARSVAGSLLKGLFGGKK